MTQDEADILAARICSAWPDMRIPVDQWVDAIMPLEAGVLGTVFVRVRAIRPKAPTIAELLSEYRRSEVPVPTRARGQQQQPISFQTHLDRLAVRAAAGDADANAELDQWEHNIERGLMGKRT